MRVRIKNLHPKDGFSKFKFDVIGLTGNFTIDDRTFLYEKKAYYAGEFITDNGRRYYFLGAQIVTIPKEKT